MGGCRAPKLVPRVLDKSKPTINSHKNYMGFHYGSIPILYTIILMGMNWILIHNGYTSIPSISQYQMGASSIAKRNLLIVDFPTSFGVQQYHRSSSRLANSSCILSCCYAGVQVPFACPCAMVKLTGMNTIW